MGKLSPLIDMLWSDYLPLLLMLWNDYLPFFLCYGNKKYFLF
jgi:hypothetical protein